MVWSRSNGRTKWRIGCGAFSLLLDVDVLCAEPGALPFIVEYQPGEGCALEERFSAQLLARSARVRRAEPGEPAMRYRVQIHGPREALIGQFTLVDLDGNETARAIPPASCDEMIAAMALIAAILVEPNVAAAKPVAAPRKTTAEAQPASTGSSLGWVFGAGAGAMLAGAVAPDLAIGIAVEVDVKLELHQLFSPWVALGGMQTFTQRMQSLRGTAAFDWRALRMVTGPMRWPSTGPLALRPALLWEVGRLTGSGEETANPASKRVTWTAFGAMLRLELAPTRGLAVALDGGVVVPLQHDNFYFAPDPPLFAVPKVGLTAQLAARAQFE